MPTSRRASPTRRSPTDPAELRTVGRRATTSSRRSSTAARRQRALRADAEAARELLAQATGDERELARGRAGDDERGARGGRGRARRADGSARSPRRSQRHRRDPRRRGRRGGQPVRPRPLRDVPGLRRPPRPAHRDAVGRRRATSAGYNGVTFIVSGDRAWPAFKYEGGGHRVQRVPVTESQGRIHTSSATVARAPRGRRGRRADRRQGPPDRRLPVERPGRPERQHHRFGRAHHPPADRHRRVDAGRAQPAAEPQPGDDRAARPPARAGRARARRGALGRSGGRRSAAAGGARRSAPTTSRRTGSPITASASRSTDSPTSSPATSTTSSPPSLPTSGRASSPATMS